MPTYETKADLNNEDRIAEYVVNTFGGHMLKLDKFNKIDRVWTSPKGYIVNMEIKYRNIDWDKTKVKYLILSVNKLAYAMDQLRKQRTPFRLVVGSENEQYHMLKIDQNNIGTFKHGWHGRTDRNNDLDREWCLELPLDCFEVI